MKDEFRVQLIGVTAALAFVHLPTGRTGRFGQASGVATGCQIPKTPGSGEWSFQAAGGGNGTQGPGSASAPVGV